MNKKPSPRLSVVEQTSINEATDRLSNASAALDSLCSCWPVTTTWPCST